MNQTEGRAGALRQAAVLAVVMQAALERSTQVGVVESVELVEQQVQRMPAGNQEAAARSPSARHRRMTAWQSRGAWSTAIASAVRVPRQPIRRAAPTERSRAERRCPEPVALCLPVR
jgi:hypothetical protein